MEINLTKKEKDILTLLDKTSVDNYLEFINKYVSCTKKELEQTTNKLIKLKLIETLKIPDGKEVDWYFHTQNVTSEMINDDIRYDRETSHLKDKKIADDKLREFQKK